MQGAGQTFFPVQTLKLYCPGVKYSTSQLFLLECWGEKALFFSILFFLLRSHSLVSALSYALIVDAIWDGHAILNYADRIGLDKSSISTVLVIKVLGAVLGLNNGFGKINPTYLIKTFSVFWLSLGLLAILAPPQFLTAFGTHFA